MRLHHGDMSDFRLGRRFGLVYVADNSFRHLTTRESQLACLRCIGAHLRPDGIVLITERRFDPSLYPGGRRQFGWSEPMIHPQTGEKVVRRGETRLIDGNTRVRGKFIYKVLHADGTETIEEIPIEGPILRMEDYLALFAEGGFDTEAFVGYEERPDNGTDPIVCFVCRKTDRA